MRAMGQAALMAGAMVIADKIYAGTIDSAKSHIDGKAGAGDFLTTRSGSAAVTKTKELYVSGVINPDGSIANQIGKAVRPNMEGGWLSEGSFVGRAANHIPGMNALAVVHDIWGGAVGEAAFTYTNVPTMFGAAAVTYGAFGSYTPLAGSLAVQK